MKLRCLILCILIAPVTLFAQLTFHIELNAPSFVNEGIIFSPRTIRKGFEDLYRIRLDSSRYITNMGKDFGLDSSLYLVKSPGKTTIDGQVDYPHPVTFQHVDPTTNAISVSSIFFLDSGSFKIELPKPFNEHAITLNSPVNVEYAAFKRLFTDLYVRIDNRFDSLTNIAKKEERIAAYITAHPDSYVALWEMISDYTRYNYDPVYLNNLRLFSDKMKRSSLFQLFESRLLRERNTMRGGNFPSIQFSKQQSLTKDHFKNYKLTFIDYWSITCAPCIRAMPELVAMYDKYRTKGIHFITITDERSTENMAKARAILQKNKVTWTNYFDIEKDFKNKVNANGYPLYFLVDQNGVIVARLFGNLAEAKKIMEATIQ